MKFKELFDDIFNEERGGGKCGEFRIDIGENEGPHIPHFHMDNDEKGKKQKKTAIRLDMPYYFLHGDKRYILNSKERKLLVTWLNSKPDIDNKDANGVSPKNNWESLKNAWNNNSPDAAINCEQPNYNLLEKDYKDAN